MRQSASLPQMGDCAGQAGGQTFGLHLGGWFGLTALTRCVRVDVSRYEVPPRW